MSTSPVITWAMAAAASVAIGAACNLDGGADPHDAAAAAVVDSRDADTRACNEIHGPNSVAIQLPNGSSVCADKHGRRLRNQIAVLR